MSGEEETTIASRQRALDIEELLAQDRKQEIRAKLSELPAPEVADALVELPVKHRPLVFRLLPREHAALVFTELPGEEQHAIMTALTNEQLAQLFNEMDPDDRAELFDEMPGTLVTQLLAMMRPEERRSTQVILGYPPDSVGRIMTPEYIRLRPQWTIQQALDHIRARGREAETIHIVYVIDERGRLVDEIRIAEILLADPGATVESIMDESAVWLNARDDREEAVRMMERYDLPVLPVVDRDHVLVGIVTFDDVADVAEEETTEDIHKGGAVAPLGLRYRDTSVAGLVRKRVGWLIILVFVNLVSATVIETYEATLQTVIALAFFIPLLIDSGGNTGSQSATIMVRAIATGDVPVAQWARTLGKELFVGLALGLCVGVAAATMGLFRFGWEIGVIVGLSMICIILTANLIGTVLPFILSRLKLDPATASSPLITSIADITGLVIYFSIATTVLAMMGTGV